MKSSKLIRPLCIALPGLILHNAGAAFSYNDNYVYPTSGAWNATGNALTGNTHVEYSGSYAPIGKRISGYNQDTSAQETTTTSESGTFVVAGSTWSSVTYANGFAEVWPNNGLGNGIGDNNDQACCSYSGAKSYVHN
jgi:hypothetical protein